MNDLSIKSKELFERGFSCSESVVRAAQELSYIDSALDMGTLNKIASPFSGSMGGSGCVCGAVAGAQIVIGLVFGRTAPDEDPNNVKEISRDLAERFKDKRKAICCRVFTAKHKDPVSRRQNCTEIVGDAAGILYNLIKENAPEVKPFLEVS